jgi:FdhD protein
MMSKPSVTQTAIVQIIDKKRIPKDDLLAVEEPMEIRIGYGPIDMRMQKSISVTMRTPGNDFELALGFLFTEDIKSTTFNIAQKQTQLRIKRIS